MAKDAREDPGEEGLVTDGPRRRSGDRGRLFRGLLDRERFLRKLRRDPRSGIDEGSEDER